jgi:hypothetical protein
MMTDIAGRAMLLAPQHASSFVASLILDGSVVKVDNVCLFYVQYEC